MAVEYKEKLSGSLNNDIIIEKNENDNNNNNNINESNDEIKELDKVSDITKYTLLQQQYQSELSLLPEINEYGTLLHSSSIIELTEKETEFVVSAIKHIFENHIVIQYNIENTLEDIILENVNVVTSIDTDEYNEEFTIPIEILKPNCKGKIYSSFKRPEDSDEKYLLINFNNTLAYITKDVDADESEEGFPDEYQIEDLSLTPGDFVIPSYTSNFTNSWDELTNEESAIYNLGDEDSIDLQQVVSKLIITMSMMPIEGSEVVINNKNHTLKLFGKSISGGKIAAIVKFAVSSKGVMMKNVVKGEENELVELVANYLE